RTGLPQLGRGVSSGALADRQLGVIMVRNLTRVILAVLMLAAFAMPASVRGQRTLRIRTLSEQEMVDMMQGSSIQASRSANTAPTIKTVKDGLAAGKKYTMISLDDLPDDWT